MMGRDQAAGAVTRRIDWQHEVAKLDVTRRLSA